MIRTKRLTLREANLEDAEFIFKLLNSPSWIQHIGDRNINSLEDAESYIQKILISSYEKNGFGMFVMATEEKSIGLCGFLKRPDLDHVDIGFAVLPEEAGKGYTYEAGKAVIENSDQKIVYGITSEVNIASRKLLQKLGLRHVRNFQFGNYEEESMLFSNEKG